MSTPLQNPAVHYGIGLLSAVVLLVIAFLVLEGTARYVVAAMAAMEVVVTPQLLKRIGEQDTNEQTA
jgi:hypothetical protein